MWTGWLKFTGESGKPGPHGASGDDDRKLVKKSLEAVVFAWHCLLGPHEGFCDECGAIVAQQGWGFGKRSGCGVGESKNMLELSRTVCHSTTNYEDLQRRIMLAPSDFPMLHKFLLWPALLTGIQENVVPAN